MENNGLKIAAIVWVSVLFAIASLVIIIVNLGFQEQFLKAELIAHTAVPGKEKNMCICLVCGKNGFAYCLHCGTPMDWDNTSTHFVCPSCRSVGQARCPKCDLLMTGLPPGNTPNNNLIKGSPIPVY